MFYDVKLRKAIDRLILSRQKPGYWVDSEREAPQETMVYKAVDVLNTLLYIKKYFSQLLGNFKFDGNFIVEEFSNIYDCVKKEGFFPSPYSYSREIFDYMDFATDCARVSIDVSRLINIDSYGIEKEQRTTIVDQAQEIIKKAFNLIETSAYRDKNGVRWEGVHDSTRTKPAYPNVYFTSSVVKALAKILDSSIVTLNSNENDRCKDLIQLGTEWILGCEKDGIITSDESKTKSEINHSVYAFLGIFDAWKHLDIYQQVRAKNIFPQVVIQLDKNIEDRRTQTFMEILLPNAKKPLYYEDPLSTGDILSVLCRGRDILKGNLKDDRLLLIVINNYARTISEEANAEEGYWPQNDYFIYYTCRCIIGLIDYELYGVPIEYSFSESEVLEALDNTLKRPELRNMFLKELANLQVKKRIKEFKKEE
ncbi:MAG: hypothetical protein HQK89_06290 [Nitrospirae bacterium]|nr:hypothetical protein [Nitrospirota bacterium]